MKKSYIIFFVIIIILVLLIIFPVLRGSTPEQQAMKLCSDNGGSFDVAAKTCTMPSGQVTIQPVPTAPANPNPANSPSSSGTSIGAMYYPPANLVDLPQYYTVASTTDMVRVDSPGQNTNVYSPLQVTGTARGTWYFEGSFPVILTDSKGRILARTAAKAQADWMTSDFVAFSAKLSFARQGTGTKGILYLEKDNPSGSSKSAAAAKMNVTF